MNSSLNVLITGAGSGLGQGLCKCLAKQGHFVIATDRTKDLATETLRQLEASGYNGMALELDVTSEASVANFLHQTCDTPIHAVVNNAGLQHVAKVEEFPIEKWDLLMNVMLRGAFLVTRGILPKMRAQGFGRLIYIGSIHSHIASPFKAAYTSAKHALVGFSKTIALETADTDITSNLISPSYIRTPLVDMQIEAQAKTRGISEEDVVQQVMLDPMPKKSFVTYDEVSAAVEYFLSPMARNVTGQEIIIDGGWTAQ